MSLNVKPDSSGSPGDLERRIDQICDAFELSYQRNERPKIEDYVDETLGEIETQVVELVMVEFAYRKKAGETPTLDEYCTRFPAHQESLRRLSSQFPFDVEHEYRSPPAIENLESYEFIGAGSFGAVWKAWDRLLKRFVAIKTPIRPIPTQADRELIQREARIVARAKHPNVVPVLAAGETDGRVYVIYEFVPGVTLRDLMASTRFSPEQAATLCAKIADAIHHIHQLEIVHRDLKPANIIVDPAGEPYVMDFGLAKLVDSASTIGIADTPLGTPAYMSPEQADGKSGDTDARSDIYSVGVILYELLAGKVPLQGRRDELIRKIRLDVPLPLSKAVPGINPELEKVCHKCLEKNKLDRFSSADELAADLRRTIRGEPVKAGPVPAHVRFWRWIVRHRLMAVAALAPLPLLSLALFPRHPPGARAVIVETEPPGATVTVTPCDPRTGEGDVDRTSLIASTPMTLSLVPGMYLIRAANRDRDGFLRQEARRTVPGPGSRPPQGADWERWQFLSSGEIKWPVVTLTNPPPTIEMAFIKGTDQFVVEGPHRHGTVKVPSFYVATREFTFGDFQRMRPGEPGNHPTRRASEQPEDDTMSCQYQWAEQWAERAGCRLLTDLEFAYLAHLASEAQAGRKPADNEADRFGKAGGSSFDEIPTNPPVRGILTGFAEWTSTWPTSPVATIRFANPVPNPAHPELLRIIRGGTTNCGPDDYPRNRQTADFSFIYRDHPHVGFRLARTPTPTESN